jgi:glutamine synthetase
VTPLDTFSGSALAQAEPDASSFPHGGSRTTFEARGYTVWDPSSPMFIRNGPHGTAVLYIPSVFITYNGEALDEKTGLLRSIEYLSKSASKILNLLGKKDVDRVDATLGTEQEFFFVDRGTYAHRYDLRMTGRTLLGRVPPKHQQLEDHYFGQIPSRVLSAISEAELELWKLGVPIKTRHNEVAPSQFEMAPIFEPANIAVDHNLLTMEILHRVAHRHKLKVLFHEKPFAGVNGSGKHCNWSMATNTGINLLDPGEHPQKNYIFLTFLVACLQAVKNHSGLLRASIASSSNDHRLGANEAPPAIVSVFLGQYLNEVLDCVEENRPLAQDIVPRLQNLSLGAATLDIKVSMLPEIARDKTDRNRTSPFAFTGNKFEFRAVGSKQSPSFPVTVLNAAVGFALEEIYADFEKHCSANGILSEQSIFEVIRKHIKDTKVVRFEGNNYSAEWAQEAASRGLLNLHSSPESYEQLFVSCNKKMLIENARVLSNEELSLRYHVLMEKYAKDMVIEARTLSDICKQYILPCAFAYRGQLADCIHKLANVKISTDPEQQVLRQLGDATATLQADLKKLEDLVRHISSIDDPVHAAYEAKKLLECLNAVRTSADLIEEVVPDKDYPLPKYSDLLF